MMPRRPLEIINALFVGALLLIAVYGAATVQAEQVLGQPVHWALLIGQLVAMFAGVLVMSRLARGEAQAGPGVRMVVNFYPMLLVPLVFNCLGPLIHALNPTLYDQQLIHIDYAALGVHPTVWLERLYHPWATDLLFVAYCTYYFFPAAVVLPVWFHRPELCQRVIFVLVLAFYVSYVGYFLVPALPPRYDLDALQSIPHAQFTASPVAHAVTRALDSLEKNKTDVFPSGHTMIAVMCMMLAARHARRVFRWLLPVGTMLVIATVYCRFHYMVDVAAGLLLAVVMLPLGRWLYGRMGGGPVEAGG